MRILDRYIGSYVIWATGLVVLVLLGIESFIEFIQELPSIGTGHYGILSVFAYVGMQMPSDLYQLFPVAGFIGSLIGLGRLAATSELIVMRAAGVSISRIGWAVIKAALVMIVGITLMGELLAPNWQYQAVHLKEKQMQRKLDPWSSQDLWLHQGKSFVHIGKVISNTEIEDIQKFDFDDQNHLLQSATARRGYLVNGVWTLSQIYTTQLSELAKVAFYATAPLGFTFQPELLQKDIEKDPSQQTIISLWENIHYRNQAGLLANALESAFWSRLLQPLITVVMIVLGVPFIFGSLRSVSMSARILTGIIVGFAFYILNQLLGPIALVYQWPAWVAGVLPILLFLLIYIGLLFKTR